MNLIVICADTVRADYLGCYGNDWVKTPNLDKLGREGVIFENAYVEGLPTIPERTVFFTGKFTLPFRNWQPLWDFDLEISKILGKDDDFWGVRTLGEGDYLNAFITDTYHFWAPGMNFHRGFHEYRWIRGQEFDRYRADVEGGVDPRTHFRPEWNVEEKELPRSLRALRQYAANNAGRETEEDYLPAKVAKEGIAWLERNRDETFFLWLDFFDPHDPWDPPDTYYDMYRDPSYEGPKLIWANLVNSVAEDGLNEQELQEAKALYAAELSLVDYWIGEFLRKVEHLGLMEDTLIVFVSDHGSATASGGRSARI
jgi:arylsulfatase A-like enzyme